MPTTQGVARHPGPWLRWKRCVTSAFRSATECSLRRRSQVVRQRFAKSPFVSSILTGASEKTRVKRLSLFYFDRCWYLCWYFFRTAPTQVPARVPARRAAASHRGAYGCTSNEPMSQIAPPISGRGWPRWSSVTSHVTPSQRSLPPVPPFPAEPPVPEPSCSSSHTTCVAQIPSVDGPPGWQQISEPVHSSS